MNSILKALLLTSIGVFASTVSHAAEISYRCEVLGMAEITGDGKIHVLPGEGVIGTKFEVGRRTGSVKGFGTLPRHRPIVVDTGGQNNAFRIVWKIKYPGGGTDFEILKVREWQAGERKAFSFVTEGAYLYSGLCD